MSLNIRDDRYSALKNRKISELVHTFCCIFAKRGNESVSISSFVCHGGLCCDHTFESPGKYWDFKGGQV